MNEENETGGGDESTGVVGGRAVNYIFWWGMVIAAVAVVDLVQIGLDLIIIGVVLNRLIDVVVGMALAFIYSSLGVRMDFKVILLLLAAFVAEQIPAIDALPLWTIDVLVTMFLDRAQVVLEKVAPKTAARLEKKSAALSRIASKLPGKGGAPSSGGPKPPPIPGNAGARPPVIATYAKTPPPIPRTAGTPPPLHRTTPSLPSQPPSLPPAQPKG